MDPQVIVVGGGPAGLMAAVGAARAGARVRLLEKGDRLGRKLLISGGGRCNVTNARGVDHILENVPGNARFLQSVLRTWSNEDIMAFFTDLGVKLKEEDRGRMFPVTDRSDTVLNALIDHLHELSVEIRFGAAVEGLIRGEQGQIVGVELVGGGRMTGGSVVVAVGGCSVPKTGSTGDGYRLAKSVGHRIVDLYPTSVPLTAADDWVVRDRALQGVSLYGVKLALYGQRTKALCQEEGDIVFTHFGLSGPAALRVSQYAVKALRDSDAKELRLTINTLPGLTREDLRARLRQMAADHPRRSLKNTLRELVPERLADLLSSFLQDVGETEACHVKVAHWERISELLQALPMRINGTLGLERATVTGGGVDVREINPQTMGSKMAEGLYFAGEVLDVHAHTGGYNITVAFSTGYVAGRSAGLHSVREEAM
ncbi:MAG: aminoacetone oxidase family FAD-binding enzyme [Firmicutes bacterium]|nr:aminoacetone oxidase family FAD-binding enzyme [Bacillota bacterium]